MIISTDAKKASDKCQYLFMIKTLRKTRHTEELCVNLIKSIYKNSQLTSYFMVRNSKLSHKDQVQVMNVPLSTPFQ